MEALEMLESALFNFENVEKMNQGLKHNPIYQFAKELLRAAIKKIEEG